MPLNPANQEKFAQIFEMVLPEASKSLSMLLSNNVSIKFKAWQETNFADAITFSCMLSKPESIFAIEANNKLAWTIADLMTGGNGAWQEGTALDETKSAAFSEALNQSLTAIIGKLKNKAAIEMQESKLAAVELNDASKFIISFSIDGICAEEAQISMDASLAEFLLNNFAGGFSADSRERGVANVEFAQSHLSSPFAPVSEDRNLNLLMDIRMGLTVELGRSEMPLKDILKLAKGSVIELDRLSGEPVDLFVNNKLIARGEVVVIDDNFGLRITQLAGNLNLAQDMGLMAAAE